MTPSDYELEGKLLTGEEAKTLVQKAVQKDTCPEYPMAWVGSIIGEREFEICFRATPYADGDNPENDHSAYVIDKRTGEERLPGVVELQQRS